MRADFDQLRAGTRIRQGFEPIGKLKCEQFTEERADTDTGKKIAALADVFFRFIISINGTIQRQFHEACEGDNPVFLYLTEDNLKQRVQVREAGADLASSPQVARKFYG